MYSTDTVGAGGGCRFRWFLSVRVGVKGFRLNLLPRSHSLNVCGRPKFNRTRPMFIFIGPAGAPASRSLSLVQSRHITHTHTHNLSRRGALQSTHTHTHTTGHTHIHTHTPSLPSQFGRHSIYPSCRKQTRRRGPAGERAFGGSRRREPHTLCCRFVVVTAAVCRPRR